MSQKNPPVTAILIAINLAVFIVDRAYSGAGFFSGGISPAFREFALFAPSVIEGEYWRLFTAAFLHANLIHLFMNMLALWQMGPMAEQIFGSRRFLLLYLVAGVLGNGVSLFWKEIVPDLLFAPSVGASGAIFGVMGAFLAIVWIRSRGREEFLENPMVRQTAMNLVLLFVLSLSAGIAIDHYAHFGGLFTGGACAALLSRFRLAPQKKQSAIALLIIASAMTLYGSYPFASEAMRAVHSRQAFDLGTAAYVSNDFATAERQFTEVLKIDPINNPALYNLHLAQLHQGKLADAIRALETLKTVLEQNPNLDRVGLDGFVSLKSVKEQLDLLKIQTTPP
jgi:rhomboid protease GluP